MALAPCRPRFFTVSSKLEEAWDVWWLFTELLEEEVFLLVEELVLVELLFVEVLAEEVDWVDEETISAGVSFFSLGRMTCPAG